MTPLRAAGLLLVSLAGCHRADSLLSITRTRGPDGLRLVLVGAPGARINARLRPALELTDGRVLRFDGAGLTPDSSYYTTQPELRLSEPLPRGGVIRASVCPAGLAVCREVTIPLR